MTVRSSENPLILMADDDEDDRELARDAFTDGELPGCCRLSVAPRVRCQ